MAAARVVWLAPVEIKRGFANVDVYHTRAKLLMFVNAEGGRPWDTIEQPYHTWKTDRASSVWKIKSFQLVEEAHRISNAQYTKYTQHIKDTKHTKYIKYKVYKIAIINNIV